MVTVASGVAGLHQPEVTLLTAMDSLRELRYVRPLPLPPSPSPSSLSSPLPRPCRLFVLVGSFPIVSVLSPFARPRHPCSLCGAGWQWLVV